MTKEELLEIQTEAEEHLMHGRYRMALASAQAGYNENAHDPYISSLLALAFLENLKPDKAVEYINLAVELDPRSFSIREKRAHILIRLSIYEGALIDLNLIQNSPHKDKIIAMKAEALAGQTKYEEAISLLKNHKENDTIIFLKTLLENTVKIDSLPEKNIIRIAKEAYEKKQFWFSIIAAEKLMKNKGLAEEASLLMLKSLADSFQINKALKFYEELISSLIPKEKIKDIYSKILRVKKNSRTDDQIFFTENIKKIYTKNYLEALDKFVGLKSLKESIKNFIAYLNFIQERKSAGLNTDEEISFHCLFLGNPGTGKTSAARLLGGILKQIGLLKRGHVVEVDRANLVGQYIGETAQKTEKVVNESLGGILFIDEAYTLKKEGAHQDFGQEAIDILLKRMEDKKGEFIVIAAGYPEEMKSFIDSNPGLKSRFSNTFYFDDFNPEELLDIFMRLSSKEDFTVDKQAEEFLMNEFKSVYLNRDKSFGNARLVKNLFHKIKLQISKRYIELPEEKRSKKNLTTITRDDIEKLSNDSGFTNYSPKELFLISKNQMENNGYSLSKSLEKTLEKYFLNNFNKADKGSANINAVRAITDEIIKEHLLTSAEEATNKISGKYLKIINEDALINVINRIKTTKPHSESDYGLLDKYLNELDKLIGMEPVKKKIRQHLNSLKIAGLKKSRGMKVMSKNLHSVFIGNQGTGKKTVARLLSKIYAEMGIIERGHLIEADKSSLVAGHQDQTEIKTTETVNKALGGILFIDEAYTLVNETTDLSREAIDTLLKKMNDNPDNLIVIAAGYRGEMETFIESSPGIKSRFSNFFYFDDYTPRQLLEIALEITSKHGYQLDEGAWQQMLEIFIDLCDARDKRFGNARTVKNILYKAISFQEERILKLPRATDEALSTITLDDVQQIRLSDILF